MGIKLGLQARLVLGFCVFFIVTINVFLYFLFLLVESRFLDTTYREIKTQYETITSFLPKNQSQQILIPETHIQRMQTLNFFYLISTISIDDAQVGFHENDKDEIYYTGKYAGFTIQVGKKITDLKKIQQAFVQMSLLLNIIAFFFVLIFSYLLIQGALSPLNKLAKILRSYDIRKDQQLLDESLYQSELLTFTHSLNHFLSETKGIFTQQQEFLQDVTHELKTPLMQMQSTLDVLESKVHDESVQKKLKLISSRIMHLNETISKLGFLLRGDENVYREKIDLEEFFLELIEKYSLLASEKNIQIVFQKLGNKTLFNSTYYLDRLFGNLISNALFYNQGNNRLTIVLTNTSVAIIDEGIGISPKEQKKIFSRFYRNSESSTYAPEGSGLGLSMVDRICKMFGWKLSLTSELGKGSEFRVEF